MYERIQTYCLLSHYFDVHQKFEPTVLHHWHVEIFASLTCSQIVIDFYPWLSQRCSEYQTWNKEKRKGFHLDQRKHFNLTIEISAASTVLLPVTLDLQCNSYLDYILATKRKTILYTLSASQVWKLLIGSLVKSIKLAWIKVVAEIRDIHTHSIFILESDHCHRWNFPDREKIGLCSFREVLTLRY